MSAKQALMRDYKRRDTRYILYEPPPSNWCYGVATVITSALVLIAYNVGNYVVGLI